MGLFNPKKSEEDKMLEQYKAQMDAQKQASSAAAHQQAMAIQQQPIMGQPIWTTSASSGGQTHVYPPTSGYISSTAPSPAPWRSEDEGWGAEELQAAAGEGWVLVPSTSLISQTPQLAAWPWGTKSKLSDKELLEDVVTQAVTGNSRIAYRILQILTRNRSPYAQWSDTAAVLAAEYEK